MNLALAIGTLVLGQMINPSFDPNKPPREQLVGPPDKPPRAAAPAFRTTGPRITAPRSAPILTQAVRSNWVKFQIVAGRLRITAGQFGNMSTSHHSGGRSEHFSLLQVDSSGPSLRYELTGSEEKLSVEASGGRFRMARAAASDGKVTPVEFRQFPGEPLCLTVGAEEQQQVFRAPSLWHLWITQPEACREHLVPLLELLRPDWRLEKVADAVEKELLRMASGGAMLDRARWAALVEQLSDDQFARREAADRQLRAASPAVLGYLQQLDFSRLDAEQQFRVRRIIRSLSGGLNGEMTDQIASWLSGDAGVWLSLLSRPDSSTRRLAARQLAAVLNDSIVFDADASEAARGRQIEELRARVEGKRTETVAGRSFR